MSNVQTFWVAINQSEVFISLSWVILDSGSIISSIFNAALVDNIWDANVTKTVYTNVVSKDYTHTASLHLLPLDVHFNSTPLANILFISEVEGHYRVTMDTTV